jgi:hypothetical protein
MQNFCHEKNIVILSTLTRSSQEKKEFILSISDRGQGEYERVKVLLIKVLTYLKGF